MLMEYRSSARRIDFGGDADYKTALAIELIEARLIFVLLCPVGGTSKSNYRGLTHFEKLLQRGLHSELRIWRPGRRAPRRKLTAATLAGC
jgi:hypothetical protein